MHSPPSSHANSSCTRTPSPDTRTLDKSHTLSTTAPYNSVPSHHNSSSHTAPCTQDTTHTYPRTHPPGPGGSANRPWMRLRGRKEGR
ncbi:hypothetical protein EJ04DRAFT_513279 [Polyplosphaeria fusca]|uniref:Uncharacterized protein n=1 Tax=Polyplosphaeria fusca TaxID=682080 RepID=A0A9P4QXY7_9PLEO|nr:hypothetical protein EJ04DRAFT_513279 [Polyplosphaeria fusca]